jgi:hypothetical protein
MRDVAASISLEAKKIPASSARSLEEKPSGQCAAKLPSIAPINLKVAYPFMLALATYDDDSI